MTSQAHARPPPWWLAVLVLPLLGLALLIASPELDLEWPPDTSSGSTWFSGGH